MKNYPLEVEPGGNEYYLSAVSKGHHDFDEFRAKCAEEEIEGFGPRISYHDKLPFIEHTWFRCVPAYDEMGYPVTKWIEAAPHSRGAFPVTFASQYEVESGYQDE